MLFQLLAAEENVWKKMEAQTLLNDSKRKIKNRKKINLFVSQIIRSNIKELEIERPEFGHRYN